MTTKSTLPIAALLLAFIAWYQERKHPEQPVNYDLTKYQPRRKLL